VKVTLLQTVLIIDVFTGRWGEKPCWCCVTGGWRTGKYCIRI